MKLTFSPLEIYKYMNDDNDYYPPNITKESTGYYHDGCPYPMYKLKCSECGNECLDDEFEDKACNCHEDSIEEPNNQN
jgi:hypothetical protein